MQLWLLWAFAAVWLGFILCWNSTGRAAAPSSVPARRPSDEPSTEPPPPRRQPWISIRAARGRASAPSDTATRESRKSRQLHQLLLWGSLLLALLPWFYPLDVRWLTEKPYLAPAGLAVQFAFACLYIWARRHLGRYWSGVVMTRDAHRLIRTRPNRTLRHLMYTAIICMFVGTAIVSGQVHWLLGLGLCTLAYRRKISVEEMHLASFFGPDHEAYRRSSWALIPGLP